MRWQLMTGADRDAYEAAHVPGAAFVDLDTELSAPPGVGGRHPLPSAESFESAMRRAGVCNSTAVVVYDGGDAMSAARCWWLLRYFGHADARVLDGGLRAWMDAGYEIEPGPRPARQPGDFTARPGAMPVLDAAAAADLTSAGVLLDARAPERFRGETEPIDPVAGHIPGARNLPTTGNVDGRGRFLSPEALRDRFETAGVSDRTTVGAYCGSGITAAHEVLALAIAGYGDAALYPGSWSEWITDPSRPVAIGPE